MNAVVIAAILAGLVTLISFVVADEFKSWALRARLKPEAPEIVLDSER